MELFSFILFPPGMYCEDAFVCHFAAVLALTNARSCNGFHFGRPEVIEGYCDLPGYIASEKRFFNIWPKNGFGIKDIREDKFIIQPSQLVDSQALTPETIFG